ncbi:hypothetical protein EATG_00142 [Escherichia coli H605]|uniref:Uncharacterized protein n=1 Tax=Escherichia coli H605 TaxID=656410 RepID=A0AAJ3NZH4_ECOLX|nr:hypothetical protein EATG_00142 [Escherichia coli H605]
MARALCIHHSPASRKPFLAGANVTASDLHVYAGCGVNALSGLRMAQEFVGLIRRANVASGIFHHCRMAQESVGLISVAHQAVWRWS